MEEDECEHTRGVNKILRKSVDTVAAGFPGPQRLEELTGSPRTVKSLEELAGSPVTLEKHEGLTRSSCRV